MEAQAADQLMGSQELADYLGVPLQTVYVWAATRDRPGAHQGRPEHPLPDERGQRLA